MGRELSESELGYYEDEGEFLYDDDELLQGERARHRLIAVFGTSYGVSVSLHVALLLVLAAWIIAAPPVPKEVRIVVNPEPPKRPIDPEAERAMKESPDVPIPKTDEPIVPIEDTVPTEEPPKGNEKAVSNKNLQDLSFSDAIGMAGGPSAGLKGRLDGIARLRGSPSGGPHCIRAVDAALRWLRDHQSPDGSWDSDGWNKNCNDGSCSGAGTNLGGSDYDVGLTGMALLAYMGNGHTHRFGTFKRVVNNAQRWLRGRQASDGSIGFAGAGHAGMYNHALATMALCELYGLTKDIFIKANAQRAVDFCLKGQNPDLGWRYKVRGGENDTSVTGWMVLALKAAYVGGLKVPKPVFQGAQRWFERATTHDGRVGYRGPDGGSSALKGNADKFEPLPVMTAVSVLCRQMLGVRRSERSIRQGVRHVAAELPAWKPRKLNFYYWYYGSYAVWYHVVGNTGKARWLTWNKAMQAALLPNQRKGGCEDGSWDPIGEWCLAGGRVYAVAINVLTLEIYYRYERGKSHFASSK